MITPPRTPDEIHAAIVDGTVRRRYIVSHEAFYATSRPKIGSETGRELCVGLQFITDGRDDGCVAEFLITEHDFSRTVAGPPSWRAAVFDDAWVMFAVEPRFFEGLATLGEHTSIEQIVELLDRLGYADATDRKDPYR